MVVSAVGQADDTALLSNDIHKLKHIFHIAQEYCRKFNVHLNSSKTKLLQIVPPSHTNFLPYNPIEIDGAEVKLAGQIEHVGVVRSAEGNMDHILQRISSFKRALGGLISASLARGHRTNPAVSVNILRTYGNPVIMSGIGSLVLTAKEMSCIELQFKKTGQNILKL